jgi:hypothetical protein
VRVRSGHEFDVPGEGNEGLDRIRPSRGRQDEIGTEPDTPTSYLPANKRRS